VPPFYSKRIYPRDRNSRQRAAAVAVFSRGLLAWVAQDPSRKGGSCGISRPGGPLAPTTPESAAHPLPPS